MITSKGLPPDFDVLKDVYICIHMKSVRGGGADVGKTLLGTVENMGTALVQVMEKYPDFFLSMKAAVNVVEILQSKKG